MKVNGFSEPSAGSWSQDAWEMAQGSDTLVKILKSPNLPREEGEDRDLAKMT